MPVLHLIPEHLSRKRERLGPAFTTVTVVSEGPSASVHNLYSLKGKALFNFFLNHAPAANPALLEMNFSGYYANAVLREMELQFMNNVWFRGCAAWL